MKEGALDMNEVVEGVKKLKVGEIYWFSFLHGYEKCRNGEVKIVRSLKDTTR